MVSNKDPIFDAYVQVSPYIKMFGAHVTTLVVKYFQDVAYFHKVDVQKPS
jgi:hypothetical protein